MMESRDRVGVSICLNTVELDNRVILRLAGSWMHRANSNALRRHDGLFVTHNGLFSMT